MSVEALTTGSGCFYAHDNCRRSLDDNCRCLWRSIGFKWSFYARRRRQSVIAIAKNCRSLLRIERRHTIPMSIESNGSFYASDNCRIIRTFKQCQGHTRQPILVQCTYSTQLFSSVLVCFMIVLQSTDMVRSPDVSVFLVEFFPVFFINCKINSGKLRHHPSQYITGHHNHQNHIIRAPMNFDVEAS